MIRVVQQGEQSEAICRVVRFCKEYCMAEKWEEQLLDLEDEVVTHVRSIPRSERHTVIRRLRERIDRLETVINNLDEVD